MPYSNRYVCFLDILGFSELVHNSSTEDVESLISSLSEITSRDGALDEFFSGADFVFQAFSDSIVMSADANDLTSLIYLLSQVSDLCKRLLLKGYLSRGAVTRGSLYHRDSVMFGPAFLSAYRLESEVARYPRVILSREVYQDLKALRPGLILPRFRLDDDGPPFLDVLESWAREVIENPDGPEIERLRSGSQIVQRLFDVSIHEPGHFEKLRWLAIYWNGTFGSHAISVPAIRFPAEEAY
jgi:hypothetical protein